MIFLDNLRLLVELIIKMKAYMFRVDFRDAILNSSKIKSNTDTEVVLSAYLKWGIEAIPKFEGMFALAIWDPRDNSLILARDRLGKKPLYFSRLGSGIVFGSEIRAFQSSGST